MAESAQPRTAPPGSPAPSGPTAHLRLRGNDLLIQFPDGAGAPPAYRALVESASTSRVVYDRRLGGYRTLAAAFRSVRERLERDAYQVQVDFEPAPALPFAPVPAMTPRSYQAEALAAWLERGGRGVVVLPTGAGKTLLALLAIAHLQLCTLVVVPTLDLLMQWRRAVVDGLQAPPEAVGTFGGGKRDLAPITIITYDSAAIHTKDLNRFGLVVFDEVHHLPAASYRLAAEGLIAPFRLGLSATPERGDGRETDLAALVGPTVYARSAGDLKQHLAPFREERIALSLAPPERTAYDRALAVYRDYVRQRRLRIASPEDFQRWIIWPSAADPAARAALLAHREARRIAFNAGAKLRTLLALFERHAGERVIVFSEFNAVVEQVSREFLIPCITHKTPPEERAAVLDGFRSGRFTKLATGRVLNEGVDVPDASVAIVLSGTGTRREYVQRLGRVLRPKQRQAVLYELVVEGTAEVHLARRRHAPAVRP